MILNHHRANQLLSAYLDGELSASESAGVQEHLMDCSLCRGAYEDLRITKGLLSQLPLAEPPAEFWPGVREPERARSHVPPAAHRIRGVGPAARSWWPVLVYRPAWAIAAALVVLAIALTPMIRGTADRLHATEIGVDLYVREHALGMGIQPLTDRAYLGLVAGDADLVLVGETPRAETPRAGGAQR